MLLKDQATGHLVEVLNLTDLFNPEIAAFEGRYNVGEELPEPELFQKKNLVFCSGEKLPKCWIDPHYRDQEIHHH